MDELVLEIPDLEPHTTVLLMAHAHLCGQTVLAFAGCGMPDAVIRGMVNEHVSHIRAAGELLNVAEAADQLAVGIESALQIALERLSGSAPPKPS